MVDACAMHGIYPYYGPFGDIKDTVACEDQFRNAFLLGCVGAWSLHPVQIEIAKRVFSPSVEDVKHARRVVAAMGDGTGAVMLDGKMEDDASLKQCLVMVELAEQLAAIDPELKATYDEAEVRPMSDRPSARAAPSSTCRAPTSGRWRRPRRSLPTRSSSTSRTPSPPTPSPRPRRAPPALRGSPASTAPRADHPGQRHRHRVARRRPRRRHRARPAPTRRRPEGQQRRRGAHLVEALEAGTAPRAHQALGDGRDADRDAARRGDRAPPTG
jgi:hypothetical protein